MGEFQAMRKYFAVFLALVACHGSLLTHGRQIKPSNQPTLPPLKTGVNVPTPSAEKKVDSPVVPKYEVANFEDSGADYKDAFRPTTPGSSPGVGHRKFAGEDNDVKAMVVVQSPDAKVSVTEAFKNDFGPTTPGHSPGVGHVHQDKSGQPN